MPTSRNKCMKVWKKFLRFLFKIYLKAYSDIEVLFVETQNTYPNGTQKLFLDENVDTKYSIKTLFEIIMVKVKQMLGLFKKELRYVLFFISPKSLDIRPLCSITITLS